ncbi:hypothetical protein [Marinococcus halotolerans]|uniref:hypothetical protein n=1 Tax=Marinococcus halotolerans TaxID=301092 RepID=UPI0003B547F6|nr:hypothetical protein [Marinococcus halotolerans]
MEWMSILPLAGIVLGAIFLAFSIFLFIIKKGGVAGPMLMVGVLAGGLGSYYFVTGEEAAPETTASSEEETKGEEEKKEETEEEDDSEKESVASEDEEESSKESSAEETGENEEAESEASDEEEGDSESDREQSKEEEEPVTGDAGGGAEEYEYTALYHLNDVYEELAYVAVSSESYYNSADIDSEYYNSATTDIYSMDEAIEEARELQNPPEGYGKFQMTYQEFLDEMQDYSDKLYNAIEEYEYSYYEDDTLEEIITTTNTPVVDAVEVMNTESDEVFEHLDLRYETQNAEWEEDFYYD